MPVFPGTEPSEIFRGLGTGILEELHLDPPRRSPSNGHIEEYHRVPSSDGLRIGRRRQGRGTEPVEKYNQKAPRTHDWAAGRWAHTQGGASAVDRCLN